MKGKYYLLITSILIIAGALAGFAVNTFAAFPKHYTGTIQAVLLIICALLLITGITGIIDRSKPATLSIVLGIILIIISISSLPFMFIVGNGSAPADLVLIGIISTFVMGFYLNGAFLNKRTPLRKYSYLD